MLSQKTSNNTSKELEQWGQMHCTHEPPYHLWCTGKKCWEFSGLSSRFTEMHMKGIKARGLFHIPCPSDSSDFVGYSTGIMQKHPEWRARLREMTKYGREWQRFVKYYEQCEQLVNNGKYKSLEEVMSGFNQKKCKLYYYEFPENTPNVELKEYLIMGSVIPREHYDEFDICHQCVLSDLPEYESLSVDGCLTRTKSITYKRNGETNGWLTCTLHHPEKRNVTEDATRVSKISEAEHKFVDSFNDYRKPYDDKMLELYKRYKKSEYVADDELPNWNDHVEQTKLADNENLYESINKKIEEHKNILNNESISENMLKDIHLCVKYNTEFSSLRYLLDNFIKNNQIDDKYIEDINKFTIMKDKCQQLMTILGNAYLNSFSAEIKLHNSMNNWVKDHSDTFTNVVYHYCPHYVLYDEKDNGYNPDEFTMHSVEIDDFKNEHFGIMTCIISISKNHILHPDNKQMCSEENVSNNDNESDCQDKKWMGINWLVGDQIEKNVMYEEGLQNAC